MHSTALVMVYVCFYLGLKLTLNLGYLLSMGVVFKSRHVKNGLNIFTTADRLISAIPL